MNRKAKTDIPFLIIITILTISGIFIFLSASLGIGAKSEGRYYDTIITQLTLGLLFGTIFAFGFSKIPVKILRKYSFWAFIISIILMFAVFIPSLGLTHGGATRWILIGPFSFQPSEILKLSYILYLATWLSMVGKKGTATLRDGLIPFLIISGVAALGLIFQKDNDTMIVMLSAGTAMFWIAGAKIRYILFLCLLGAIALGLLITFRPYIKERIISYFNPHENSQSIGFQSQHSINAIGSGGFAGRGFGQSLQKFTFLPEPVGDSIFAVAAEEFGFIGASSLIILFLLFAWRGLKIAGGVKDNFSRLVVIGIVILICVQAFWNMGTMMRLIPISGLPLPFVSHGGTALFLTLCSCGILLNISKQRKALN